jgi:hypothetical protein
MALPHRFIGFYERRGLSDTRVIYENVRSATKLFAGMREGAINTLRIGDVTLNRQRLYAIFTGKFFGYVFNLRAGARRQRYRRAFAGKGKCDSAADAATATGD